MGRKVREWEGGKEGRKEKKEGKKKRKEKKRKGKEIILLSFCISVIVIKEAKCNL